MAGTEHFDQAAATWDLCDRRVQLALAVAKGIASRLPLSRTWSVLDFGCGTGLLTLALAPSVGSITGADTSSGMLETLAGKAEAQGIPIGLRALDASGHGDFGGPYHLIVSSMTLHHIADVPALFRQFARDLHPGGRVALADLDSEDGSFHEEASGVQHQGFARDQVRTWLKDAGFQEIGIETATVTHKGGRDYPVFLASALKG